MKKEDENEDEKVYIPVCPSCGYQMIRAKKYLKAARVEVEVWVCPTLKTPSCID
jgi:hypothetical protein